MSNLLVKGTQVAQLSAGVQFLSLHWQHLIVCLSARVEVVGMNLCMWQVTPRRQQGLERQIKWAVVWARIPAWPDAQRHIWRSICSMRKRKQRRRGPSVRRQHVLWVGPEEETNTQHIYNTNLLKSVSSQGKFKKGIHSAQWSLTALNYLWSSSSYHWVVGEEFPFLCSYHPLYMKL